MAQMNIFHCKKMSYQVLQIIGVILAYCSISIILVFANKYLVGHKGSDTDVSLFVVWVQCIVTVLFVTGVNFTKAILRRDWTIVRVSRLEIMSIPILRMTVSFVCMLSFNNLCLRYVDVSFYQVARSMTIIFVVIFTITVLHRSVSWGIIGSCGIVAIGFFLGIDQEQFLGTLSVTGVFYGVMSSVFVALNGVYIKQALDVVDGDSYKITYYSNINASLLFIPVLIVTGQFSQAALAFPTWTFPFWIFLLTTGVLCFFIAWIGGVQINLTSTITHHIIANTKAVLQTLIAVLYYNQVKSFLWWVSVFLVVIGAFTYTMVRLREEKRENILRPMAIVTKDVERDLKMANQNNNSKVLNC